MAKLNTGHFQGITPAQVRPIETVRSPAESPVNTIIAAAKTAEPIFQAVEKSKVKSLTEENVNKPLQQLNSVLNQELGISNIPAESNDPDVVATRKLFQEMKAAADNGRISSSQIKLKSAAILKEAGNAAPHLKEEFSKAANDVMGFDVTGQGIATKLKMLDASDNSVSKQQQRIINNALDLYKSTDAASLASLMGPPQTLEEAVVFTKAVQALRASNQKIAENKTRLEIGQQTEEQSANSDASSLKKMTSAGLGTIANRISEAASNMTDEEYSTFVKEFIPSINQAKVKAINTVNTVFSGYSSTNANIRAAKQSVLDDIELSYKNMTEAPREQAKINTQWATELQNRLHVDSIVAHKAVWKLRELLGDRVLASSFDIVQFAQNLSSGKAIGKALNQAVTEDISSIAGQVNMSDFIDIQTGDLTNDEATDGQRESQFPNAIQAVNSYLNANQVSANNMGSTEVDAFMKNSAFAIQALNERSPEEAHKMMDIITHPKFQQILNKADKVTGQIVGSASVETAVHAINSQSNSDGGQVAKLKELARKLDSTQLSVVWNRDNSKFEFTGPFASIGRVDAITGSVSGKEVAHTVSNINKYIKYVIDNKNYLPRLSKLDDKEIGELLVEVGGIPALHEGEGIEVIGDSSLQQLNDKQKEESTKGTDRTVTKNEQISAISRAALELGKQFEAVGLMRSQKGNNK